jgi:hypothetical protein
MNEIPTSNKAASTSLDLSTWEGDEDSSSESTHSQHVIVPPAPEKPRLSPLAAGAARALAVEKEDDDDEEDDDYYDENFYPTSEQQELPSTREPSPEPLYRGNYACEYVPQYNQVFMMPSKQVPDVRNIPMMPCAPMQKFLPVAPAYNEPPAMHPIKMAPVPGAAFLMPTALRSASLPQQDFHAANPKSESKMSSKQREPKTTSKQQEEVRVKSASKGKGQGSKKSHGKNRDEAPAKGDTISNLSEEKKQLLAKYIYDLMLQKGFTSPDGYLLVDILAEVWKDMGDGATGGRIAQHRFAELLRVAPHYFELFRKGIRVTNHCGWFARKGEKMVRLIAPQTNA